MTETLKLCPEGLKLYNAFCVLAEQHGHQHPQAASAWKDWYLHKVGDSTHKGCEVCSGLKRVPR